MARGNGWAVWDVVCTSGPFSRPFEEKHSCPAVAIVMAGTFQYQSGAGRELMTPGSILLGNSGQCYECGHEHGVGDRCVSFSYAPEYFDRLTADAGASIGERRFRALRLPPLRDLSPLIAHTSATLACRDEAYPLLSARAVASRTSAGQGELPRAGDTTAVSGWEELAIRLAAQAVQLDRGIRAESVHAQPGAEARVTRTVRRIEAHPEEHNDLASLAHEARLSPYHFLRTFEALTGVTPHQYLLRIRLRHAAIRIRTESARILDIALDCGFGDVSNFNRTFRAEFGVSPRAYRMRTAV